MKVYGKWLVKAYVLTTDTPRIASTFNTRKECTDRLDTCFKKVHENLWEDSLGQRFYIEKNTNEYI